MEKYPNISFRPNPSEEADLQMLVDMELYRTVSGAIHDALGRGIRDIKLERGLMPTREMKETDEVTEERCV